MTFRVSSQSGYLIFNRNLALQNQKTLKLSEQLSTGKKINRPSDDPVSAQALAELKRQLSRNEQFEKNLQYADRQWRQIESDVMSVSDLVKRAREIAIQGNNGTLSSSDREALAAEVAQLSEQLLTISNRQLEGQYIYSGYRTNTQPYEFDANHPAADPAVTYLGFGTVQGNFDQKRIEVSEGQFFPTQIDGEKVFRGDGTAGSVDYFQAFANLENALRTNNIDDDDPASIGQAIEDLGIATEQVAFQLAEIGGLTNRIEKVREDLEEQKVLYEQFISQTEDIDVAEVAFEYQRAQLALQATVSSAASLLNQPSLFDFLR